VTTFAGDAIKEAIEGSGFAAMVMEAVWNTARLSVAITVTLYFPLIEIVHEKLVVWISEQAAGSPE
jgi:hypothetical protein